MINKIKTKINQGDNKKLLGNFFSLSILQLANYVLPLIIIPFLFTRLGADKFGLVIFAQIVVMYFGLVVNYGFNLTGPKEIGKNRDSLEKIEEIFSTITTIKFLFSILMFLPFLLMINYFDKFNNDILLYILSYGSMIESVFFPFWFFQGMEKMKYITIIYSFSKIIVTILIFLFINNENDYLFVPMFYLIGSIITSIITIYTIRTKFNIKYKIPSKDKILFMIKDSYELFVSNIIKNSYKNLNMIFLGFLASPVFVGYYALAEKVIRALQALMGPISDTLYPYIANKSSKQSEKKSLNDIFNISKYYTIIALAIVILILITAPFISYVVGGSIIEDVVKDIRILSLIIIFGVLNDLFGIIGLVNLGEKKYFMKSLIVAGIMNIIFAYLLINLYNDIGAAIAIVITEFILTLLLFTKLLKLKSKAGIM